MTIERLDQDVLLPLDMPAILSGDPKRLASYLRELVQELQQYKIYDIHQRVNLLLDRQPGNEVYLGGKDANGNYPDGTWRISTDTTAGYLVQLKVSGSWVTKFNVTNDGAIKASALGLQSVTVASDYTVAAGVYSVLCDTSSNTISVTLPALTGQRSLVVSVDGSYAATIVGTINGDTDPELYDGETMDLTDLGTEWRV